MGDKYWFHKKWGLRYEDTPTELLHNKIEQLESQIKKLADKHPLTQPQNRNFRLGAHIRPRIVKARFVKWPRYVQIQRKNRILCRRFLLDRPILQSARLIKK